MEVLKTLPPKSIDMMVTSPPYWALRDYGATPQIWDGDPQCDHEWTEVKITKRRGKVTGDWERPSRTVNAAREARTSKFCKTCEAWLGTLGLEPTIKLYIKHLIDIANLIKPILADHGTMFFNIGDTYYGSGAGVRNTGKSGIPADAFIQSSRPTQGSELPSMCLSAIPERLIVALIDDGGWIYRNRVIWHKPNPLPESIPTRFSNDHELLPFFVKKPKYYFKQQFEPAKSATIKRYKSKKLPKVGGDKYTDTPTEVIGSDRYSGQEIVPMADRNLRCVWNTIDPQLLLDVIIQLIEQGKIDQKTLGDVWTIAPAYLKDRIHFATYPPALIRRPIDAGCPKLVCTKCGKPQRPVIEKLQVKDSHLYERKVTGWTKCDCDAPFRKGRVFDPFMGSGTTAIVAEEYNLDWLGIELVEKNIEYAYTRIGKHRQTTLEGFV